MYLEGNSGGEVLSEGVPPQVVLLQKLLNVFGRRTAGTRLEQPRYRVLR